MTRDEACEALGLGTGDLSLEAIDSGYRSRAEELDERILEAPTAALRKKYMAAKDTLVEARDVLKTSLGGSASMAENLPVVELPTGGKVETLPVVGEAPTGGGQPTTGPAGPRGKTTVKSGGEGGGFLGKALLVLAVLALAGGGAFWWFSIESPKRERAEVLYASGMEAYEAKRLPEAEGKLKEAVSVWLGHPEAVVLLEKVSEEIRRDAELSAKERAREVDRGLAEGRMAQSGEEWEQALAAYEKVLSVAPENAEAEVAVRSLRDLLANARGSIKVSTEPGGASVSVAGVGEELSPASFGQLKLGSYTVQVEKKGYDPVEQKVRVSKDRITPVEVRLDRSEGVLQIRSEPEGMEYSIRALKSDIDNARELEFTKSGRTPAVVADLPTGKYEVKMKRPGWPDYLKEVTVGRDGKEEVTTRFAEGTLELTSDPSGAEVRDAAGKLLGKTPYRAEVPTGEHVLSLKQMKYKAVTARVLVEADGVGRKRVVLEEQPFPVAGEPYENSLGMKFVPAGTDGVLFSVYETRVKDYRVFVEATNHDAVGEAFSLETGGWKQAGASWKDPHFPIEEDHPVTCVSWDDAVAFCRWLTEKDRKSERIALSQKYRLPKDLEWSAALGLEEDAEATPQTRDMFDVKGKYPWGDWWPPNRGDEGNYAGSEAKWGSWPSGSSTISGYRDAHPRTAPVGTYKPNGLFELYDMGGNVWEMCEDWFSKERKKRVIRGADWNFTNQSALLSSGRFFMKPSQRGTNVGFRCVLVVGER